jgi:hypothetical protein
MNRYQLLLILCFICHITMAQFTPVNGITNTNTDSIGFTKKIKQKKQFAWVTSVGVFTGISYTLNNPSYNKHARTNFHFFNDNDEWKQIDKAGHVYTAYHYSRLGGEIWRNTGFSERKRVWYAATTGWMWQMALEISDGFAKDWGFSMGDIVANTMGSVAYAVQELGWKDQRISMKFSFHKNNYQTLQETQRANQVYGNSFSKRLLKDYNSQTYWLSFNMKSFLKKTNLPPWLNIAVGYGADDMYGARGNGWNDPLGSNVDRSDLRQYRQWYLSPDIDFTKIKTKNKLLKGFLFCLNALKMPAPSLELNRYGAKMKWFHF